MADGHGIGKPTRAGSSPTTPAGRSGRTGPAGPRCAGRGAGVALRLQFWQAAPAGDSETAPQLSRGLRGRLRALHGEGPSPTPTRTRVGVRVFQVEGPSPSLPAREQTYRLGCLPRRELRRLHPRAAGQNAVRCGSMTRTWTAGARPTAQNPSARGPGRRQSIGRRARRAGGGAGGRRVRCGAGSLRFIAVLLRFIAVLLRFIAVRACRGVFIAD